MYGADLECGGYHSRIFFSLIATSYRLWSRYWLSSIDWDAYLLVEVVVFEVGFDEGAVDGTDDRVGVVELVNNR